ANDVIPAHKYAQLADVGILRVNANVNIPQGMSPYIETYLTKARLTKDDYVKSIMWGLKGCPLDEVPKLPEGVNKWSLYFNLPEDQYQKYVYTHRYNEATYCMDPFCCEIATDLLKELEDERNEFLPTLSGDAKEIRNRAKALTWTDYGHDDWGDIEQLV